MTGGRTQPQPLVNWTVHDADALRTLPHYIAGVVLHRVSFNRGAASSGL